MLYLKIIQCLACPRCSVSDKGRRHDRQVTLGGTQRRRYSLNVFHLKPLTALKEGTATSQLACLNRICCDSTQPRAGMPTGKVMKGVFFPSRQVLN